MEILAELAIWIIVELLIPLVEWLLRPLENALRSANGGLVLATVWLGCGGCCWLAWQFGGSADHAWVVRRRLAHPPWRTRFRDVLLPDLVPSQRRPAPPPRKRLLTGAGTTTPAS